MPERNCIQHKKKMPVIKSYKKKNTAKKFFCKYFFVFQFKTPNHSYYFQEILSFFIFIKGGRKEKSDVCIWRTTLCRVVRYLRDCLHQEVVVVGSDL